MAAWGSRWLSLWSACREQVDDATSTYERNGCVAGVSVRFPPPFVRQLQEHVFKLPDHSSQADWSDLGRYYAQPTSKAVKKGVNHVHMANATSTVVHNMKSFGNIKPKKKGKGTDLSCACRMSVSAIFSRQCRVG